MSHEDFLQRLIIEQHQPISNYEWPAVEPSKPRDPWDDLFTLLVEFEAQAVAHGPYDGECDEGREWIRQGEGWIRR